MHTIHGGLSIVAPLVPGQEKTVSTLLKKMNANPGNNSIIPLTYSKTTLIASGAVIPVQYYGKEKLPALLVFFTSYCGSFKAHFNELLQIGFPGLCELFQYCEDFPETAWEYITDLRSYLMKHKHSNAFYSGMHHISRDDIERERMLRNEIDSFIYHGHKQKLFKNLDEVRIRQIIQQHIIDAGPKFDWARTPQKLTLLDIFKRNNLIVVIIILVLLIAPLFSVLFYFKLLEVALIATIAIVLGLIVLLSLLITYIESSEQKIACRLPDKKMRRLAASQLNPVLNEMTVSGIIKQGRIRRFIFRLSLIIIKFFLSKRNIPTIATARWVSANNGKRLLFTSNFANTANSYVRDFIDSSRSTMGINVLFCHGEGYPPTRFLCFRGAFDNPEGFMNVFHNNQLVTQFWYCPFSTLSVDNIKINRQIRNGLFGPSDEKAIKQWLKHL